MYTLINPEILCLGCIPKKDIFFKILVKTVGKMPIFRGINKLLIHTNYGL